MNVIAKEANFSSRIKCLLYSTKTNDVNGYIFNEIYAALQVSLNAEVTIVRDNAQAISQALSNDYDLFLAYSGENIDHELCKTLAKICGRSAIWLTEDPYQIKENLKNIDIFDLIFTNDEAMVSQYGAKGRHLLIPGSKNIYFKEVLSNEKQLKYDVFFCGTAWPNRVRQIKTLLEENKNQLLNLKISMPTNEALPDFQLSIPMSEYDWRCTTDSFANFSNISLVTLALPREFSGGQGYEKALTPPPRVFEVAMSGSVQLVHTSMTSMSKYFEDQKDFFYYSDVKECLNIVKELRQNFSLRTAVAKASQRKAVEHYDYQNSVEYILDQVTRINPKKPKIIPTRKKIMFVLHNDPFAQHYGGVEVYLRQMRRILEKEYDTYFFYPTGVLKDTYACVDSRGRIINKKKLGAVRSTYDIEEKDTVYLYFEYIINKIRPDLVHFHHILHLPTRILEIPKKYGVRVILSIHDYYLLCDSFNLIDHTGRFCEIEKKDISDCELCVRARSQPVKGFIGRRVFINMMIDQADAVIVNTKDTSTRFGAVFPSILKQKALIEMPVSTPHMDINHDTKKSVNKNYDILKIAVLGNLSVGKGGAVVMQLVDAFKSLNIEFHFFGRVDQEYQYIKSASDYPNVTLHGAYQPGKIPKEVQACDVSLHLSIWPETYCLALSESWLNGLVPIVSDIGAISERVLDGVNGYVVKYESTLEAKSLLLRIYTNKRMLDEIDISNPPIFAFSDHTKALENLYESVLPKSSANYWQYNPNDRGMQSLARQISLDLSNTDANSLIIRRCKTREKINKLLFSLKTNGLIFTAKKVYFYLRDR